MGELARGAAALMLLASITAAAAADDLPATANERFDCADTFDLVARMVVFRCDGYIPPAAGPARIEAALARLRATDLITAAEIAGAQIAFCPLAQGTGMVPAPGRIYVDDGLLTLSADGLAEIIAHEFVHVHQFAELGTHDFKCAYVHAMLACGGCQDRGHRLEAEAYRRQDEVRARLLGASGTRPEK